MRIALLTTDGREVWKDYGTPTPHFGTAVEALLQGFARMPEVEVHVVTCARARVNAPPKLAANIFFHSLFVPKLGWLRTGYQGCIRAVRNKLKEIRPDVVHGQGTERDCAICAVFSGFPNVVTIHGNMAELARQFGERVGSYGWLAAKLETFTLKRTDGVLCNSAYTEQLVQPRARRTWRVANALREMFFAAAPAPGGAGRCTPRDTAWVNSALVSCGSRGLTLSFGSLEMPAPMEVTYRPSLRNSSRWSGKVLRAASG